METIKGLIELYNQNRELIGEGVGLLFLACTALFMLAEFIVALTPTKSDDLLLARIGVVAMKIEGWIRWLFEKLKIPINTKK